MVKGKRITYEEFTKMTEKERCENYRYLSDKDKFKVRQGMYPGVVWTPCNDCVHYRGFNKCVAYPQNIPNDQDDKVRENLNTICGDGYKYEKYEGPKRVWVYDGE